MSLENALALVEQVKTLHLMPGDRIFVKVAETTQPDEADTIGKWFREQFPDHRVLIIGGGIDVSLIREGSPAHEAIQLLGYDAPSTPGAQPTGQGVDRQDSQGPCSSLSTDGDAQGPGEASSLWNHPEFVRAVEHVSKLLSSDGGQADG